MSGTTSTTSFGAGDDAVPAAIGGGGSAGPSVGAGDATGTPVPANSTGVVDTSALPAQYSTSGNLGFFTRQMESVPTAVAVGPDGALYISELGGLPYPEGYARVLRVADPNATTGFDGQISSGVPEVYASGFSQINGLSFDGKGNLYVLEFVNSSGLYDPTQAPGDLPPSQLVRVSPDGVRTTVSGPELRIGNYVLADKDTGDVYVSIGNADLNNGEVLRYRVDPATGQQASVEVVASGLNNPRGLSFGPDGELYVMEQGKGTPGDSPDVASAPDVPFIPGLVNTRGGYTGAITRVDTDGSGDGGRVFTGLPSLIEHNPTTGEDRVLSIGPNGFTIAPDGTVFIASGAGLSEATAGALGPFGENVRGLLKVEGLFDGDPSDATITPTFDSVAYAAQNGPDGSTTLFNNQSNLNDVVVGADGKVYTVDAARNVMYGFDQDNLETPDSATVFQKRAPVLTPPQYAAVVASGGDPNADYQVEITGRTTKNASGAPDTPGRAQAAAFLAANPDAAATASAAGSPPGGSAPPGSAPPGSAPPDGSAPPRGEDSATGSTNAAAASGLPGDIPLGDPAFPGPIDPLSPPIRADNPYTPYFDPFFGGNYDPGAPRILPAGEGGGVYAVSRLFSFGDRLSDDGGTYSAAAVADAAGVPRPNSSSLYYKGGYSDGPMWTENLERILGVATEEDRNFAYVNATARELFNPVDPLQPTTNLTNFQGQIAAFEQAYARFSANDLVTVNFGGNDLTLPAEVSPEQGIALSVQAIVDGLDRMADLGARHFLVTNVANVELAPLFKDPSFLALLGASPGTFTPLVDQFNDQLEVALASFEDERGVDVELLDVNKLFDAIVADPLAYGFTNVTEPVLALPPIEPGTPEVYNPNIVGQDPAVRHSSLFLDPVFHPTALGHSIVAETARSELLFA
jgi:phospholipase/lecithinase/hemolysin/sugar lactone lactonase YvrE